MLARRGKLENGEGREGWPHPDKIFRLIISLIGLSSDPLVDPGIMPPLSHSSSAGIAFSIITLVILQL